MNRYDAILVLGGGVREGGALPIWASRRLDRALEIHSDEYLITLSAGTVHRPPPLDADGFPILESVAASRYLIQRGADPAKILVETSSYDTIGNAYFARVIHVDPGKFHRLLVITSKFHMPRTSAIFRWVYGLSAEPGTYELSFEAVSDEGIDEGTLVARREKERQGLGAFEELAQHVKTLQELHRWLFTRHAAYAGCQLINGRTGLTKETLATY